jgi:hypothetical protein
MSLVRIITMNCIDRLLSRACLQTMVCTFVIGACFLTLGCVRRKLNITSSPSGALVYLNDREVGRTPVDVDITYYGTYDVRLLKEGYEPLMTSGDAPGPLWDLPGPDFIAELLPVDLTSETDWHYELEIEDNDADALLTRAEELRNSFQEALSEEAQDPAKPISDLHKEDQSPAGLQMINLAEPDGEAIEPAQDDGSEETTP